MNDNSSLTNVLVEIGTNGDEICYYTIGADLVSQEINGKVYTYLYDGHGTVRALANENGKVTDTYTYDAFGNLISSTGSTANSYRYCGEQFDSTTGLYYLRARYMDTNTGRFISQDTYAGSTADPTSLHKYLYANSNPVSNSDPSGYSTLTGTQAAMAGMAAIGGIIALNALGIFHKLTDGLLGLADAINDLFDDIETLVADISSGNVTSAEANEDTRDEAVGDATGGSGTGSAAPDPDDNGNKKPKKNKNEPPETDNLKWSKKAKKLFEKLSPEQKKMAIKTITEFINGTSKHNNHPLFHDRAGQWALDIIGMGKGRGGGRIIYVIVDGVVNIIEIITGHNY